jgi:hypothetical protein
MIQWTALHISVMSGKWTPKNKSSLILHNYWFLGKFEYLSINIRRRTYILIPEPIKYKLTWQLTIYSLEATWLLEWSIGIGWEYHHIFKEGHIQKTTCGSAEFESWNWSNVKMYRDDIPIGSECLLEKYCEHVFESCAMQTEMKWNVLARYILFIFVCVANIYMVLWFCKWTHKYSTRLFVCLSLEGILMHFCRLNLL